MKIQRMAVSCLGLTLALLCCIVCASCNQRQAEPGSNTEVKNIQFAITENYIFADWGKIYRFDRSTETFSLACTDPDCDSNRCPLECVVNYFAGVSDGKVYFSSFQQFSHNTLLSYLDIATGECVTIKTMSEAEDPEAISSYVEDGWWYYPRKILKEGGDASNSNDYDFWLCKISLDGQNDQTIRQLKDTETIQMVAAGVIVTHSNGKFYATDIDDYSVSELFDFGAFGFTHPYTDIYCVDNKAYFLAASTTTKHSEYTQQSYPLTFLICIDLNTKQAWQVLDQPLCYFYPTGDTIYYVPFELRHIYIPDNYEENPSGVMICLFEDTIYQCDLNGENSKKLYSNDQIDFAENVIVIDGILYGWLYDYNEATHTYDKTFFGGIDLKTGRVIRTEKPQKAQGQS